ncbi:MAG: hypothetical protein JNG88_14165 [Phycisphaerales bacterium]|nr:hypothetical protein [Phycisphaerales bacterium]
MATVIKKAYTMPLPAGAELFDQDGKRMARWRLRNGKLRCAEVIDGANGKPRARGRSTFYP